LAAGESACESIDEVLSPFVDLQSNLDLDLRLKLMARRYGCSPFHFHRLFSKVVGETPKKHVDRLRLERAAYELAVSRKKVVEIALSVGFKNHETFTRRFKRAFGFTPRGYRVASRTAQAQRLRRNRGFRGDGCRLSEVKFVDLPPAILVAIRRHGAYAECPVPFSSGDGLWNALVEWARRRGLRHRREAIAISYDDPTVTPAALQRLDACIPVFGSFVAKSRIRRLNFSGGKYAGIQHEGPIGTIDQAYRAVADGIRSSRRYEFDLGPPIQIYRKIHEDGDAAQSMTEVYFPVRDAN
jgi:AraC family transcriptional regulator